MADDFSQASGRNRPSAVERRLSLLLIGLLVLIGAAIFQTQFDYDPDAWRVAPQALQGGSAGGQAGEESGSGPEPAPPGFTSLSPAVIYDRATLSDKIDGKAELYLAAGFRRLETRRLGLADESDAWLEQYIYDMGSYANAFSVYSAQRRPGARALDLTGDAYLAANGLFFVNGPFYIEIIASRESAAVQSSMADLARRFVVSHPVSEPTVSPLALLPRQDQIADSAVRVAQNAFGLDGFDDVYTAAYQWQGAEAVAFVTRRSNAAQAQAAADALVSYFTEFGGRLMEPPPDKDGPRIVEVLGSYEVIQTRGTYLYGAHEAGDLQQALALTGRIGRAIETGGEADADAR